MYLISKTVLCVHWDSSIKIAKIQHKTIQIVNKGISVYDYNL